MSQNSRKRSGTFFSWPTAETVDALPPREAALVAANPCLHDLFVRPPVGLTYRIVAAVVALLTCIGAIGLAVSDVSGETWTMENLIGGGFALSVGLVLILLSGGLADSLRMPARALRRAGQLGLAVGAAVGLVLIVCAAFFVGMPASGWFDEFPRAMSGNYTWRGLSYAIGVAVGGIALLVFVCSLQFSLLGAVILRISDTVRWYWLRQAAFAGPPQPEAEALAVLDQPGLRDWFILPQIRIQMGYYAVLPPLIVLGVIWLTMVGWCIIDSDHLDPVVIGTLMVAWVYPWFWAVSGTMGQILDLLRAPPGKTSKRATTYTFLVAFAGGLLTAVYSQESLAGLGLAIYLGNFVYQLILGGFVLGYLVRAVRTYYRRQQIITDVLEDALDIAALPPPPDVGPRQQAPARCQPEGFQPLRPATATAPPAVEEVEAAEYEPSLDDLGFSVYDRDLIPGDDDDDSRDRGGRDGEFDD